MREFGVPALAETAASANLTDTVFRRAGAEPGVVVLRRRTGAGDWQDVTAAEFGAEVTALARGLVAVGVGPGDRVAVMSRTRYEWTLIDYACWAAGAVTVPVYENLVGRAGGVDPRRLVRVRCVRGDQRARGDHRQRPG